MHLYKYERIIINIYEPIEIINCFSGFTIQNFVELKHFKGKENPWF